MRVSCATANHAWHLYHRHPICAAFIPSLIGRQDLAALQVLARFLKGIRPESLPIPIEMQQHAGILRRECGDGKRKQPRKTAGQHAAHESIEHRQPEAFLIDKRT